MATVYRALARRLKRAGALMERGRVADAKAAYEDILSEAPENEEARYNLSVANAQLGNFADATKGFRAVIAMQPNISSAHASLANALEKHRIDRFEPSVELVPIVGLRAPVDAYSAAINAIPLMHSCHRALAQIFHVTGRRAQARTEQMTAGLYGDDLAEAMLDLSSTMARPGDLQGALALHRRRVAEIPNQWEHTEQDYLNSDLHFTEEAILSPAGFEVMMEWERPIMERSAEIICHNHGDVLNVGFGMGIIDSAIQRCGVRSHTIIEAHPQVVRRAKLWAQDKKGVTIISTTWQNALESLSPFDGIYFDTLLPPMVPFLKHSPNILKKNGVISFFQYDIDISKIMAMIREDFQFGIEYIDFDWMPDNTYYRLREKNASGRYTAPLFVFRKI